jgi:hypothetical protein
MTPPLGVTNIIARTFRLLVAHFGMLFPLAFVPTLVIVGLGWATLPDAAATADAGLPVWTVADVVFQIIAVLASLLITGLVSLAALDAVLGKRHTLGEYTSQTLRHLLPILVLGTLLAVASGVAFIFLIVPGIYVLARFLPWIQAVLFENAGWSGLGRAQALTEGYRWPLVGATLVIGAVYLGLVLLIAPLAAAPGPVAMLLNAAISSISYVVTAIFIALVYVRLREIREGLSIEEIAALID